MLPLLGKTHSWYGDSLLGVFLGDDNQPELDAEGRLFLLISNVKSGENLILNLRAQPNFVIDYKINDFETMVVMQITPKFLTDYRKFIIGKYSHLSDEAKKLITDNSVENGTNVKILRRDKELRERWEERIGVTLPEEAEVYPKPEPENERFKTIKEIKEREASP